MATSCVWYWMAGKWCPADPHIPTIIGGAGGDAQELLRRLTSLGYAHPRVGTLEEPPTGQPDACRVDYVKDARLNVAFNVGAPNSEIRQRSLAVVELSDERDALHEALRDLVAGCEEKLSARAIENVGRDLFDAAHRALKL